jgi:hypothetical protein
MFTFVSELLLGFANELQTIFESALAATDDEVKLSCVLALTHLLSVVASEETLRF